jgi:hypothetical protein
VEETAAAAVVVVDDDDDDDARHFLSMFVQSTRCPIHSCFVLSFS